MLRGDLLALVNGGIAAVASLRLVHRTLPALDSFPGDVPYRVIAAGKAAASMALAAHDILGGRVAAGVVIAPSAVEIPGPFTSIVGEHPRPGEGSERGGRAALALARQTAEHERLLV